MNAESGRRVAQMPRAVRTTTEDGCPRCLAFGIWESTDLCLGKLKKFNADDFPHSAHNQDKRLNLSGI
jgi:hypothetical protein